MEIRKYILSPKVIGEMYKLKELKEIVSYIGFEIVEIREGNLEDLFKNEIIIFLKNLNYKLFAKCFNTVFFIEANK